MDKRMKRTSKFLSLILRHHPQEIGLTLDEHGWADVDGLIHGMNEKGHPFVDLEYLEEIVRTDEKGRYSFNDDHTLIRANQGHSIPVDVELSTASIVEQGLLPMSRLYVHLSPDIETAQKVGIRHGKPIIYEVDCRKMVQDGHRFFRSANFVWLVKAVPAKYLKKLDQ